MKKYSTVEEYISSFPQKQIDKMEEMRAIIKSVAPEAEEIISYNMPAYKQNGILVYFAAYEGHIGFYPTPNGITHFQNRFNGLKYAKGSVQFPIDSPLPKDLIADIVKFRLEEDFLKKKN